MADLDPHHGWDSQQKCWVVPATGIYLVSVMVVYRPPADGIGLLSRIRREPSDSGTIATNVHGYTARADRVQMVGFTRAVTLSQGDRLDWPSRTDGYSAHVLVADYWGVKTDCTVVMLAGTGE